jgi:hypothetical protein
VLGGEGGGEDVLGGFYTAEFGVVGVVGVVVIIIVTVTILTTTNTILPTIT